MQHNANLTELNNLEVKKNYGLKFHFKNYITFLLFMHKVIPFITQVHFYSNIYKNVSKIKGIANISTIQFILLYLIKNELKHKQFMLIFTLMPYTYIVQHNSYRSYLNLPIYFVVTTAYYTFKKIKVSLKYFKLF